MAKRALELPLRPEMELVNKKLPKPGVRFSATSFGFEHATVQTLMECGIVTRELLTQVGFFVIDDCHSVCNTEQQSRVFWTQFLHKDDDGIIEGLTLRAGPKGRGHADTVVACDDDGLQEAILSFLGKHADMVNDIRKVSVAEAVRWRCRGDIKRALKLNGPVPGLYHDSEMCYGNPKLSAFYTNLEKRKLLYRHQWEKNQALVMDNRMMVHGCLNSLQDLPIDQDVLPLFRAGFYWNPDHVLFL